MIVAHWIRHQDTKQFRAVMEIDAQRRWCLTGTPIQNRLEDVGSLIKFIRVVPFVSNAIFRRYIIEPLLTGAPNSAENLRLLLGSVCLRRTKRHLKLSEAIFETVPLNLSTEEQILYSEILEMSKRALDDSICSKSKIKRYSCMFTAIIHLRMLCNLGTFYKTSTPNSSSLGTASMDKSPTVLPMEDEATCEVCSSDVETPDLMRRISLGSWCLHLLCSVCLAEHEYDYPQDEDGRKSQCRLCNGSNQPMDLYPTPHYQSVMLGDSALSEDMPPPGSASSMDTGHSTKLTAVLKNIEDNIQGSKRFYSTFPLRPPHHKKPRLILFCTNDSFKHCILVLDENVRSSRIYSHEQGNSLFPNRWSSTGASPIENNRRFSA
jgi:SWI/SNF-related matrix-associated actin-dependent regulator of chromatin subfamily A3